MVLKMAVYKCLIIGCIVHVIHAQSCTQKVLVEEGTGRHKKVTMVRKIPAKCSNWDKAWVWITGMDCGTKYVLETVNFPSAKTQVYKEQKVCCQHELNCKNPGSEAQKGKSGLDENDQKFLAITFGSATAALVIILLIIVISFCRKKQPRFIENFFNRRHRMYEEDIIGVEPSAPYLEGQGDYHYKNGCSRLIESEYEEIPEYHAKDKYPIVDSVSEGNDYVQEFPPPEQHSNNNHYTRDVLISLASGNNESETIEKTMESIEKCPSLDSNSGSYENAAIKMLQPVQETGATVNGRLSQNSNDNIRLDSLQHCNRADSSVNSNVDICARSDTNGYNSPSKCSENSVSNDYIDFSNVVVPNNEQNPAAPPAKVHSYEQLDVSAREKDNLEQTYDALKVSVNECNLSTTGSGS
ncbi:uncharacterized protein LOC134721289 [Mytilus trossulus]|uniref:uncharacterized protein LOC134721289 n=1 Tax=Mytilus trossulus TaxID=6551 RepID=UPI003004DF83